jgi:hypothetical protein
MAGLTRFGFENARDTVEGAMPHASAISVSVTRRWTLRSGMDIPVLLICAEPSSEHNLMHGFCHVSGIRSRNKAV